MADIVERLRAITGQAGDHGDVQLCDEAADEIERLRAERRWIPVTERLPERNEIVLVVDQGGVTVGSYSPMLEDWWTLQVERMSPGAVVSHWMPLPPLPPTE